MDKDQINQIKEAFRAKYQNSNAENLGVIAAYQRAHLYTPRQNNSDIRIEWESQLKILSEKYKSENTTEADFIKDILQLKDHMNKCFPGRFNNGTPGYDNEFRIAHAQKSLSICLKHLWVRGELGKHMPPVCPIDGVLLKYANNNDAWTKVNSIEDRALDDGITQNGYKSHLNILKKKAEEDGFKSLLSEWELYVWWQDKQRREDAKNKKAAKPKVHKNKNDLTNISNQNRSLILRVYDGPRTDNIGTTLQIINNALTLPHTANHVYIVYRGNEYEASIGTYRKTDTLRGKNTIKQLIADNHWQPGQEFMCDFSRSDDDSIHEYRIK